jgi:hypothetical protein
MGLLLILGANCLEKNSLYIGRTYFRNGILKQKFPREPTTPHPKITIKRKSFPRTKIPKNLYHEESLKETNDLEIKYQIISN